MSDSPSEPSTLPSPAPHDTHDTMAVWRIRDYKLFSVGTLISALGSQMLNLTVEWELYGRTHDYLKLGLVGLVLALPVLLFSLPVGAVVDAFDRRRVALGGLVLSLMASFGFLLNSWLHQAPGLWTGGTLTAFYGCLFVAGCANAFSQPTMNALLPQLVPEHLLANAVTWNSSRGQLAAAFGPTLGSIVIAHFSVAHPAQVVDTSAARFVYVLSIVGLLVLMFFLTLLRPRERELAPPREAFRRAMSSAELIAGLRFVRSQPILLATMAMDMAAVLLGGAVFLLPVFAKDILGHGETLKQQAYILGLLKSAPSVGSALMALALNFIPIRRAGRTLLWAVGGFGVATIVFGISRNLPLSIAMLFLTGLFDQISVVVRWTLVTVLVPDHMRGRVGAVNAVFIGASNELGGFESGAVAKILNPVSAVVLGGIGTLLIVGLTAGLCPPVLALGALRDLKTPKVSDLQPSPEIPEPM